MEHRRIRPVAWAEEQCTEEQPCYALFFNDGDMLHWRQRANGSSKLREIRYNKPVAYRAW
ncbi:hypothetical protein GQA12_18010 [Paenibacillus alvei]|nr:hypothetical protein [Paenibacillus alvei]